MTLENYRFELDGFEFGLGCSVASESFDPGGVAWRKQRADSPREGARYFGKDVSTAGKWAWSLFTDATDDVSALDLLAQFKNVWRARAIRDTVGAVLPLTYKLGNRTRVVYGRPDNFAAPLDNKLLGGRIDITADFELVDDLTYDTAWKTSGIMGLLEESSGGFSVPFSVPFSTTGVSTGTEGHITVGGDEPTWAVIKFYGPNSGSAYDLMLSVDGGAWTANMSGPLVAGEVAILDSRPWVRTITREGDGSSYAGQMASKMWLMKLEPGTHSLIFTASDTSGTSRCAVSWQEASSSL